MEIDVAETGVKGAKEFFEAQVSYLIKNIALFLSLIIIVLLLF